MKDLQYFHHDKISSSSEGRFNRGFFALRVWVGLIFGGAYFRNFTVFF